MTDVELERERKILHEAFMAGWQAALAVKVTNPAVLAVVESCFELWLEEEVDEQGVLGLPFRRRYDLPRPKRTHLLKGRTEPGERRTPPRRAARRREPVRDAVAPEPALDAVAPEPVREAAPTPSVSPPPLAAELPRQREDSDSGRAVETSGAGS